MSNIFCSVFCILGLNPFFQYIGWVAGNR